MNKFIRHILIVFALIFISSCGIISSKNDQELLQGVWIINHSNDAIDYSIIEYQSNGDKCEIAFSLLSHLQVDMYWNKWRLEDGVIHSTMHNTNTFLEYGYQISDKIKTLNEQELFVDMVVPKGDYSTEYHYKNQQAQLGQVCDTVRKLFQNKSKEELNLYRG